MKRQIVNLVFLILILNGCSSARKAVNNKEFKIEIWTEKSDVQKAIEFERSLSNKFEILEFDVSLSNSVFPLLDQHQIAKPFILARKKTEFLPIYAEYYFSEQDSILKYISYDWEKDKYGNFFKKQEIWKEEKTKLDEYNKEYDKIKKILVEKFGKPIEQDTIPQTTKSIFGKEDYLSRNTVWKTDGFNAKLNMIFGSMTYRIRLNYYWK